ncbi:hypothetical protein ONZ51_g6223 [Trametes cubensis]|uniref:Protein SYM1 n=1 Tax=Trametes cubensis TaxID=1111947 RepID=A0AAD7X8L9_9APHY|nr:hypothetical protein ONZ51_g6223 [Trametes cubensis]
MANVALARVYQQSFESHPYTTLAFTNGALNALGDVVAQFTQRVVEDTPEEHRRQRKYDVPRTLRFFAFGFGMGPLIGRWNFFLERHFPLRPLGGANPGKVSLRALARRVGADQLFMAPIGVWPLAQLINFRYMPLPYRVPFQSTCGVFWTLYLSLLNAKEDEIQDRKEAMERMVK